MTASLSLNNYNSNIIDITKSNTIKNKANTNLSNLSTDGKGVIDGQ